MSHRIKILVVLLLVLFLTAYWKGASKLMNHYGSPLGEWNHKWVRMDAEAYGKWQSGKSFEIVDQNSATYPLDNGRIYFYSISDNQRRWEGYWVEELLDLCPEEKDGSTHWGVAIFQFNDSYTRFEGTWDLCGEGEKMPWIGWRPWIGIFYRHFRAMVEALVMEFEFLALKMMEVVPGKR